MKNWLIISCLFLSSCKVNNRLPDLRESYFAEDKKPFGTKITKQMIDNSFPDALSYEADESFAKLYYEEKSLFITISNQFYPNTEDLDAIDGFLASGNTMVIAASKFDTFFLNHFQMNVMDASSLPSFLQSKMQQTGVRVFEYEDSISDLYQYFYFPFRNHFLSFSDSTVIVGFNDKGQPNFIRTQIGEGTLFVHCEPRVFSNYFMLTDSNYQYFNSMMETVYNGQEAVYWDNFYRTKKNYSNKNNDGSYFSELMKHRSLKAATLIFMGLLLLYVLLESRRKRPVIPIIPPNTNSSLAFTETIAQLYLQQRNNKDIALKMITYFNEYLRSKYFLQGFNIDEQTEWLSKKSGVLLVDVKGLAYCIRQVNDFEQIDDELLAQLNEYIFKFYK